MPRTRSATATTRRSCGQLPTPARPTTWSSSARDLPAWPRRIAGTRSARTRACCIFDVHPIFGGEAKQNEFEVDGVRLWGPQGSNGNVYPIKKAHRNGLRCAVVARARPAGGIRLAGTEGSREGTAHSARRVRADAHHLGIGRPGLLLRGQGLRRQSVGEPLQGCADSGAAQAGHDLDGDIPPAPAPRGLGEVARRR